jgi:hypothetical protein
VENTVLVLAAIVFIGIGITPLVNLRADEPDPLALPCTIGATAVKSGHTYLCDTCGSETCWILQK